MELVELKVKIKEMLVNDLKIPGLKAEEIKDDEALFGDEVGLGLDSLDAVELVVLVQKHFNIQIATTEEGQKAFASVNALADYIKEHEAQAD